MALPVSWGVSVVPSPFTVKIIGLLFDPPFFDASIPITVFGVNVTVDPDWVHVPVMGKIIDIANVLSALKSIVILLANPAASPAMGFFGSLAALAGASPFQCPTTEVPLHPASRTSQTQAAKMIEIIRITRHYRAHSPLGC